MFELDRETAVILLKDTLDDLYSIEGEWGIGRTKRWVAENSTMKWWKEIRDHFDIKLPEIT